MEVRRGGNPEGVNQALRHTLWVEGNADGFDEQVLRALFTHHGPTLQIRSLGPCWKITAAAEALSHGHPDYYFLIDRDHQAEDEVNRSWELFPDPAHTNLLIWTRRELESYFIDPDLLARSSYLKKSADLTRVLVNEARRHLWRDALNHVLVTTRHALYKTGIEQTDVPVEDRTHAIQAIREARWRRDVAALADENCREETLIQRLDRRVDELTGGSGTIQLGFGSWMRQMGAKAIFKELINKCFALRGASGRPVQGRELEIAVARELVSLDRSTLPEDFTRLIDVLTRRVRSR